jgi:hypothetical protein
MSLNWTGTWSDTTTYNVGDAVSWLGSSYVATIANVDVQPNINPTKWDLLAAAGSTGASGDASLSVINSAASPQGLNWRGAYSTLTSYNNYDVVSYNSASYICIHNGVLNKQPDSNPTYWDVLCAAAPATGTSINVWQGVPTGTVDGTNATYTLPHTPTTLLLFRDGQFMHSRTGNDYTLSGSTITYATALQPTSGTAAAEVHYAVVLY